MKQRLDRKRSEPLFIIKGLTGLNILKVACTAIPFFLLLMVVSFSIITVLPDNLSRQKKH